MSQTLQVVIVPSPGMGHLIPFIEFAKHLVHFHDYFNVTCIIPTIGTPPDAMKASLLALPSNINHIFLPPISFEEDRSDHSEVGNVVLISLAMTRSLPSLRHTLKSLIETNTRVVALLVDSFGTAAFDVANEFKLSSYLFFTSNAMALSTLFYLPKLDEMVSCEFRDLPEPVKIPGCVPVNGRDIGELFQDRKSDTYKLFLNMARRFGLAKGIVLNTFIDIETGALKALMEEDEEYSGGVRPPIYPIGPMIRAGSSDRGRKSDCLTWLDNQPSGSVLYVSFGSGGTLSHNQLIELAFGLEMSQQRFIWVVRSPNDESANAAFFKVQSEKDPFDFLPDGFLERTKQRGLVISSWAPQIEVLGHGSTGGFLTHCGWNSILESVVYGVPMIAWPLFAEQKINAVMLTEDVKVAFRPEVRKEDGGLVIREEIAKVVKKMMEGVEGKKVRKRMRENLTDAASKAFMEDGASRKSLLKLALEWKNQKAGKY
ncbi:hypothetical protein Ddye_018198 [Dipteronia dyeriana]|uniref:Glycosyltransferase n=1 Tax=Dipteronia dyeriana TaxID=168575 RepID=A0AAD9UAM5_9ROSI|nr:hypothetical protein Ddye_018198 [Dipteronia dyeriana]